MLKYYPKKNIVSFILVVIMCIGLIFQNTNNAYAVVTVNNLEVHNSIAQTNEERVFKVTYTIHSHPSKKDVDVVLVLDRSNSMLYSDGQGGVVVNHVKSAALNFLQTVLDSSSNNKVAVVDYGTQAQKLMNGNFTSNKNSVINAVNYSLKIKKHMYKDWYWNWGWHWHWVWDGNWEWVNHNYYDGATNIKDGFNKAKDIMNRKGRDKSIVNRAIILFTDGAATRGGNYYDEDRRPTSHNSNTIVAYKAGQAAQSVADVFTIGYFYGLDNWREKSVARDTLERAQNAGFYEAPSLDELNGIFNTINKNLNYTGKNAVVTDVLKDGFEFIPNSFESSDADVELLDNNKKLKWNIGTLGNDTYQLSIKIRAKNNFYPTGKQNVLVNDSTKMIYDDIKGVSRTMIFDEMKANIPSKSDIPKIVMDTEQNQEGYLVGDIVNITDELSFNNSYNNVNYDFKKLRVNTLKKKLINGDLNNGLTMIGSPNSWISAGNNFIYNINTDYDLTTQNKWTHNAVLDLLCNKPGTYTFKNDIEYILTNVYDKTFSETLLNVCPKNIKVREGRIRVKVKDKKGSAINDVQVNINDTLQSGKTNAQGEFVSDRLKTGHYTVKVDVPYGYIADKNMKGAVVTDDTVEYTVDLNYNNNLPMKQITLESEQDIWETKPFKNVSVLTIDGNDFMYVNNSQFDAKIEFEIKRSMKALKFVVKDDYTNDNINVNSIGNVMYKKEPTDGETQINGFNHNGSEINYSGGILQAGHYTVYVKIQPPNENSINDGNSFKVFVPEIYAVKNGEIAENMYNNYDIKKLNIEYDDTPPVIDLNANTQQWASDVIVTAVITSTGAPIKDYKCAKGDKNIDFFNSAYNSSQIHDLNVLTVSADRRRVETNFTVKNQLTEEDKSKDWFFEGNDIYTVYTKDEAGNENVKTIRISNVFTNLPDLT